MGTESACPHRKRHDLEASILQQNPLSGYSATSGIDFTQASVSTCPTQCLRHAYTESNASLSAAMRKTRDQLLTCCSSATSVRMAPREWQGENHADYRADDHHAAGDRLESRPRFLRTQNRLASARFETGREVFV